MKRKLFTFLMAFLAIAGNAVWAQEQEYTVLQSEKAVDVSGNGKHYYTTNGETINKGGINVTSGSPTIYLKDFKIEVDGSAITVSDRANPIFVLLGENKITSKGIGGVIGKQDKAAIDIASLGSMTISEESTGILEIEMTSKEEGEQVAIGAGGTGRVSDSGSLTVNGGTIVTNGYLGGFYNHAFRMGYDKANKPFGQGSGLVYAKDIVTSDGNWLISNGMYSESEAGSGERTAVVAGNNVILKSPIPEGCKVSIATNDGESTTLTIDKGKSYKKSQIEVGKGGTLNAYEVVYTNGNPETITVEPTSFPTDEYLGGHKELGEFTSIDPDDYYFWGWLNDKEIITATGETPEGIEKLDLKGVWVVKNYTVEVEKNSDVTVNMVVPSEAASLVDITLPTGNKDWTLNESTKVISGKVGEEDVTLNVTVGDDKKATLTFNVKDEEQGGDETTDISTGYKLNISELTYNGQEQDVPVTVEDNEGNKLTAGTDYTVTPAKVTDVQEGGYSISVEGIDKYTGKLTGTLTVKPATLKATVDPIVVELNGEQPNFKNAKITYAEGAEPFEGDDVTIDLGDLTINTSISGEQEYTFKSASLTGSDAGNYVLEGSVTVKIIVGEGEQGGDDEDKTDLASQVSISIKDEGKIFVYNGDVQEQDATRLVIVENKETGDIYEENVDFKVEIGHGNTSNFEEAPFKLAGNYSIRIVPIESEDSNLKGESQVLENVLTIYPRKVAVKANPLYYTIGKEDEVNLKDVIVEIEDENTGICEEDKGFVSIRLVNNPQLSEAYKEPGIYTFTYKVELLNASPNYTITNDGEVDGLIYVMKNITDEDPMNPGNMEEGNDSDISLQEGWEYVNENIYKRLYDGLKHPLHTIYVKVMKDNEPTWVALQEEREEFSISGVEGEIKNAGHYNLEITLNGEKNKLYDGKVKITLVIIPAQLSVDLNLPVEVKSDDDLASIWSAEDAIIEGEVNNEEGKIEGTLSEVKREGNIMTVTVDGLALKENRAFLPGNYEPIYKNHGTEVTIDEATGKPYVELKIEDAKAEDLKPGEGEGWTEINGTYTRVYDGKEHPLTSITVDGVSMTEGFTVDYNGADKVKDAGTYLATVTFTDGKYAPTTMVLTIQQRPMEITFDLPETIKEGETLDIHALIRYQQMSEDCGLIDAEGEPVIKSGQLVVTAPYDNGKCAVILKI